MVDLQADELCRLVDEQCDMFEAAWARGVCPVIVVEDSPKTNAVMDGGNRVLRGCAFDYQLAYVRSGYRNYVEPRNRVSYSSFRAARTYPATTARSDQ